MRAKSSDEAILRETGGAIQFEIHAKPRAKRSRALGLRGAVIEIAIGAPPVDGAANEELIRFLAETLGVAKREVRILRGESSQRKLISVSGVTLDTITNRLIVVT